jgi:oxygen-independent coproporphyrinogen-3 oxidase
VGNINTWKKKKNVLSLKKYYFYILMMGLRMKEGLDLRFKKNRLAYNFFSSKLKNVMILNDHLFCNNIDILNQTLIDCL